LLRAWLQTRHPTGNRWAKRARCPYHPSPGFRPGWTFPALSSSSHARPSTIPPRTACSSSPPARPSTTPPRTASMSRSPRLSCTSRPRTLRTPRRPPPPCTPRRKCSQPGRLPGLLWSSTPPEHLRKALTILFCESQQFANRHFADSLLDQPFAQGPPLSSGRIPEQLPRRGRRPHRDTEEEQEASDGGQRKGRHRRPLRSPLYSSRPAGNGLSKAERRDSKERERATGTILEVTSRQTTCRIRLPREEIDAARRRAHRARAETPRARDPT